MNILHVGILSPHVIKVMRLLWRQDETLFQEICQPEQLPVLSPDVVMVHGFHEFPADVERYLSWGVPVVARPWNDRWMDDAGKKTRVFSLFRAGGVALVVGSEWSLLKTQVECPWVDIGPLVDTEVFKPADGLIPPADILPFFAARLLSQDVEGVYWGNEIARALHGLTCWQASGYSSPPQMAHQMQRSKVVISICGREFGPSDTTLEAIFCGKIPVLADIPAIRPHFEDAGQVMGARLATRDVTSIRRACLEVLELSEDQRQAEYERNMRRFAGWTLQAQQERIAGAILSLGRVVA